MELSGALSNPRLRVELPRLSELHGRLVAKAAANPILPRSVPSKASPVLETVTRVLEQADRPMRATEIHKEAAQLAGQRLLWASVKGILAANASGSCPLFQRVGRGYYKIAEHTAADR